jgi:hypothetical protein
MYGILDILLPPLALLAIVGTADAHRRFRRLWALSSTGARARADAARWGRIRALWGTLVVVCLAGWLSARMGAAAWGGLAAGALLAVWALRHTLEHIMAGWVLLARAPFGPGDLVEVEGIRGIVVRAGLTCLRIRGFDHVEHDVPWTRVQRAGLSRLSAAASEMPVEVDLPWAGHLPPTEARDLAALCACTSPLASLQRRPETFLVSTQEAGASHTLIRVRGYVFDAEWAESFRSHVLEAWMEASAEAPAPPRA